MRIKILVATLLLVGGLAIAGLPAAQASSGGCTLAPGSAGALNCVSVEGIGTFVGSADSSYNAMSPVNVCNPIGRFQFKRAGASSYSLMTIAAGTCGFWKGWVTWGARTWMANNSSFCATQRNSVISSYANFACVGIWN